MITESFEPRIDYRDLARDAVKAIAAVERYARGSNIEPALLELVKIPASMINSSAYCVDMHSEHARAQGESEQRLHTASVWREAPFFIQRERAAPARTEAVREVRISRVPDQSTASLASTLASGKWWI